MIMKLPSEVELISHFSRHLGGRFQEAGVRIQFQYNEIPGIHFKVALSEEYRAPILRGLKEGMAIHFPDFPENGSVWITEVIEHEVNSCEHAFYLAARLVVEQASSLASLDKVSHATVTPSA